MNSIQDKSDRCGDYYRKIRLENKLTKSKSSLTSTSTKEEKDLEEIYSDALDRLSNNDQNPKTLLRLLQSKVSERYTCSADQRIKVRKVFEAYADCDGHLDIHGFRKCLGIISCPFDETQSLALFAYFDDDRSGTVEWSELVDKVIVLNPKSGELVPKSITRSYILPEDTL